MTHPWLENLSTGEWSPETFRRRLEEAGTPLVRSGPPGEVEVTFVDEPGDSSAVTVAVVIGPAIAFNPIDQEFDAVAGTPFQTLTLPMREDLRFAYVFDRRGPTGKRARGFDPFNPPPRFSGCAVDRFSGASVAVLPGAMALPWLDQAEAQPTPDVGPELFVSDLLGNERRVWISMPTGERADDIPLPVVIHLDGTPGHSAPSVRDALLRAGVIRPCAVVLIDQLGEERYHEQLCNPAFSRMLVEELLPWLRDRYPISGHAHDVALAGESFGGLCAAWTALHAPTAFGNAIIQSPSCGFHPHSRWGTGADELLARNPVPTLIDDYLTSETAAVRIFHDVGELEGSLTLSRWFDQVLRDKGYETAYREFSGGHDYSWWRGLFADALTWCFPAQDPAGS